MRFLLVWEEKEESGGGRMRVSPSVHSCGNPLYLCALQHMLRNAVAQLLWMTHAGGGGGGTALHAARENIVVFVFTIITMISFTWSNRRKFDDFIVSSPVTSLDLLHIWACTFFSKLFGDIHHSFIGERAWYSATSDFPQRTARSKFYRDAATCKGPVNMRLHGKILFGRRSTLAGVAQTNKNGMLKK